MVALLSHASDGIHDTLGTALGLEPRDTSPHQATPAEPGRGFAREDESDDDIRPGLREEPISGSVRDLGRDGPVVQVERSSPAGSIPAFLSCRRPRSAKPGRSWAMLRQKRGSVPAWRGKARPRDTPMAATLSSRTRRSVDLVALVKLPR